MTQVDIYLALPLRTVTEIWRLKYNGVTTLIFGVMWRQRSRDHYDHAVVLSDCLSVRPAQAGLLTRRFRKRGITELVWSWDRSNLCARSG